MTRKRLDPAVYVLLGVVGVALVSVLLVFATRSCVRAVRESFAGVARSQKEREEELWASEAVELEPQQFAAFVELAESVDLGIGVHLGTTTEEMQELLGKPDASARTREGVYEHDYFFLADSAGPSFKERHRGSLLSFSMAFLMATVGDDEVIGFEFACLDSSPQKGSWSFLTFDDKPLLECARSDFVAVLGKPTKDDRHQLCWRYRLAGEDANQGLLVEVDFLLDEQSLTSFAIERK